MLTNPNTLGIFNSRIEEVVRLAHERDALVYYDGANLNAVLGKFRPGDAGIDVMHVNLHKLKDVYDLPFDKTCMHEFVLSARRQAERGVHALDIAKALIDRGFHPPTVYFPLIVKEALMIEPTECESRETLDAFVEAMREIAQLAEENPEALRAAPITTPVSRPDDVLAARSMDVCYQG